MPTLDAANPPGEVEELLKKKKNHTKRLLTSWRILNDELQNKDSMLTAIRSRLPTLTSRLEMSQADEPALQSTA